MAVQKGRSMAIAMLAGLLAACGGGQDSPHSAAPSESAAPAQVTPPAPASAPAAAPPSTPTTGSGAVAELQPPPAPAAFTSSISLRTFTFSWAGSATATRYEFFEDADGAGPGAPVTLFTPITDTSYTLRDVPLHLRVNAEYSVRSCNAAGCSAPAKTQPDIRSAVGYFKAGNAGENDQFGFAVAVSAVAGWHRPAHGRRAGVRA